MESIIKFTKENIYKILFVAILLLAIFTRFYRVAEVPHGIHVDEAGMAYDAYCLANYGTDRYLNPFPVYLINFGGGQSALYAYLAAIFIKTFGLCILTMRLPAVLLGITAIVLCYFMTRKTYGEKFALTFMALVTICPWHIMASRWGLDCNLFAPLLIISIFFMSRAKKTRDFIIAGIFIGITLYTYSLSYLVMPLFLAFSCLYMIYTKKATVKQIIIMAIPVIIIAMPLILMILVNNGIIPEIKGIITIPKMWYYRAEEIGFVNVDANSLFYKTVFTNDLLVYNALPEFGTIYYFAIFLSVFGGFVVINNLVEKFHKKEFKLEVLMLFAVLSIYFVMLLIIGPNINKANAIFIPLLFLACIAIRHIYQKYKYAFYLIMILYIASFYSFSNFYFTQYEKRYEYQPFFESDLTVAIEYVEENYPYSDVYISTDSQQPWVYTLLNNKISPMEFNESRYDKGNMYYDFSYGKYHFSNSDYFNVFTEDNGNNRVYIVKNNSNLITGLIMDKYTIYTLNSYVIASK